MGSDFSLDNMTVADKLNAMERLWESLRDTSDNVPSPDWHHEILEERERRLANGVTLTMNTKMGYLNRDRLRSLQFFICAPALPSVL